MRITRKPVSQITNCSKCGQDFQYMRTLGPRKYCDDCADAKKAAQVAIRRDRASPTPSLK